MYIRGMTILFSKWVLRVDAAMRQTFVYEHAQTYFNFHFLETQSSWVIHCRAVEKISYLFILFCWRKISERNLDQRINIKFWVKISEIACETLVQLKMVYDEHAMKTLGGFEWHKQFKEGWDDVLDDARKPRRPTLLDHEGAIPLGSNPPWNG